MDFKEHSIGNGSTIPVARPTEAAQLLDCSPRTVMRMCERGELAACKVGSQWRINRDSLMEYIGGGAHAC